MRSAFALCSRGTGATRHGAARGRIETRRLGAARHQYTTGGRPARTRGDRQPGRPLRGGRAARRSTIPTGSPMNRRLAHAGDPGAGRADHRPQHLAGHPVRPLDQPVSRLRARLHLLLRPPDPCLARPFARPRFRDPGSSPSPMPPRLLARELAAPGYRAGDDRARDRHRPLPAGGARAPHHPGGAGGAAGRAPSRRDHHEVRPRSARPRYPGRDGRADNLVLVAVSLPTLDPALPGGSIPARRGRRSGSPRCGACPRPACP